MLPRNYFLSSGARTYLPLVTPLVFEDFRGWVQERDSRKTISSFRTGFGAKGVRFAFRVPNNEERYSKLLRNGIRPGNAILGNVMCFPVPRNVELLASSRSQEPNNLRQLVSKIKKKHLNTPSCAKT